MRDRAAANAMPKSRILSRLVAGTVSAALLLSGCTTQTPDNPELPADASRVLQSVAVTMSPDGAISALNSTAVATRAGVGEPVTSKAEFAPAEAADSLPFRVLTAYRTKDKAGTNLADLEGHTGRVEIELTVENTTIGSRQVSYDVAGESRTQAALVGVPLTVVAAAQLPGTASSTVVTGDASGAPATNGVLSQNTDGNTVVQWASILAPPQLGSSATLRLVVDATNFKVPTVNLSVQPGMVTDASITGLLDSAFSPDSSGQLELQTRTIELIGEANSVLARASKAISKVRANLTSTSKTLGSRTVNDLKSSTSQIAASMEALDAQVEDLGEELSTSLTGTQSNLVALLSETVAAVDQALGDTATKPQTATVSGEGCAATVTTPQATGSVYGNLMQVVSQLDGYAQATGACKTAIQASLLAAVGPAEPDATTCTTSSATCALYAAKSQFAKIADKLVADGAAAIAALDSATVSNAMTGYGTLSTAVGEVSTRMQETLVASPFGDVNTSLAELATILGTPDQKGTVDDALKDLSISITNLLDDLNTRLTDVHDQADTAKTAATAAKAKNSAAVTEVCNLVTAGDLDPAKASDLLAVLDDEDCAGLPLPAGPTPLSERLDDQIKAWDDIMMVTQTPVAAGDVTAALKDLKDAVAAAQAKLKQARTASGSGSSTLAAKLADLDTAVTNLDAANSAMSPLLTAVQTQQAGLESAVTGAFADAASSANSAAVTSIDPQVRQLTAQAATDAQTLGEMFTKSASGLSVAATKITENGTTVVDGQKKQLGDLQTKASTSISDQVSGDLLVISDSVSASGKDVDAATKLLTNDLRRVLLDLGDRKVKGSGLLGAMVTSADTADTADYQLALASQTTTSYANVRASDVDGILLRQAQVSASLQAQQDLPAFQITIPAGAEHRTIYAVQIGGK